MQRHSDDEWTLAELADETGLPARTIRFYIARNLLAGPVTAGRGAVYTKAHVDRLKQIRQLQTKGRTLAEIARQLEGERGANLLPPPASWWQYEIDSDVMVSVRGDVSPWRMKQIRAALEQLAQQIKQETDHE